MIPENLYVKKGELDIGDIILVNGTQYEVHRISENLRDGNTRTTIEVAVCNQYYDNFISETIEV